MEQEQLREALEEDAEIQEKGPQADHSNPVQPHASLKSVGFRTDPQSAPHGQISCLHNGIMCKTSTLKTSQRLFFSASPLPRRFNNGRGDPACCWVRHFLTACQ